MQGQLTQAEQHAAQYKSVADSVEASLREQTEASEQFKQTLETRISNMTQGTHSFIVRRLCDFSTLFNSSVVVVKIRWTERPIFVTDSCR